MQGERAYLVLRKFSRRVDFYFYLVKVGKAFKR